MENDGSSGEARKRDEHCETMRHRTDKGGAGMEGGNGYLRLVGEDSGYYPGTDLDAGIIHAPTRTRVLSLRRHGRGCWRAPHHRYPSTLGMAACVMHWHLLRSTTPACWRLAPRLIERILIGRDWRIRQDVIPPVCVAMKERLVDHTGIECVVTLRAPARNVW